MKTPGRGTVIGSDAASTRPCAPSATTLTSAAAGGTGITVSKPLGAAEPTLSRLDGDEPASSRQRSTPVAPFQLA